MKRFIAILLALALTLIPCNDSSALERTERIQSVLDVIVEVCAENWDEHHGYPSCCAMIAAQESLFGAAGRANNLWGLACGRASYSSLENGVIAWLKCLNNGWYGGAPKADNGDKQLHELLSHGYCQPPGNYYQYAMRLKSMYNLGELDEQMFRIIEKKKAKQRRIKEKKKRRKLQKLSYIVAYDPTLLPYQIRVHRGAIKDKSVIRIKSKNEQMLYTWLEVIEAKPGDNRVIYIGNWIQAKLEPIVWLDDVIEDSRG